MLGLILGCAANVWNDAQLALTIAKPDVTIAVKDMIWMWPLPDHGVTYHPERIKIYRWERERRGSQLNFPIWSTRVHIGVDHLVSDYQKWFGSTGLLAVKVALDIGCDKIILAGVPMEASAGHVGRKGTWNAAIMYHSAWLNRKKELMPLLRSMSGWTREQFGEPTKEWIGVPPPMHAHGGGAGVESCPRVQGSASSLVASGLPPPRQIG